MAKNKLQFLADDEIIFEYITTYAKFVLNMNTPRRGTKTAEKYLDKLGTEMLRRGLLTPKQLEVLES